MKVGILRFLKKLSLVALLLLAIDLALGKILDHFGDKLVLSYTLNETSPGLLILGTSKALHQYVPAIFEEQMALNAYNAGGDGQSILYAYALLQAISERESPEVVVLDLRPYEFYEKPLDYDRLSVLLPYYDDYDAIKEVVHLRGADEKIKCLSSLYRYNAVALDIVTGNFREPGMENKGYIPAEGVYKAPASAGSRDEGNTELPPAPEAAESAREADDDGSRELDPVKIRYFEKFVETVKSNGGHLYVFVSPLYNQANYAETMQIIGDICDRENVFFRDLSQDTTFVGKAAYFRDPGHLNEKGAGVYTRKVAEIISEELAIGEPLAGNR